MGKALERKFGPKIDAELVIIGKDDAHTVLRVRDPDNKGKWLYADPWAEDANSRTFTSNPREIYGLENTGEAGINRTFDIQQF
ncbi:MAG: hypothetical protein ACKO34_06360 [Vampirovibrionales bacterium]